MLQRDLIQDPASLTPWVWEEGGPDPPRGQKFEIFKMPQNGVLGVIWAEKSKKEVKITLRHHFGHYQTQFQILVKKVKKSPFLAKMAYFSKKMPKKLKNSKFPKVPKMVF